MKRWKPSKTAAREFAETMSEIKAFCLNHGVDFSSSMDSYYFCLNGQFYRVSNHSVESSKAEYHPDGRKKNTIYIHASKTRLIDIYQDLENGHQLDGRGNRV